MAGSAVPAAGARVRSRYPGGSRPVAGNARGTEERANDIVSVHRFIKKTRRRAREATCWPVRLGFLAMVVSHSAAAQNYPVKPLRLIAPSGAGGPVDVICRIVSQGLAEVLGQQVVVDNRVGAAGLIGTELVAKAPPDGYTLLFGFSGPLAIVPNLNPNTPYDPLKDLVAVSQTAAAPYVLLVHPSVPASSVRQLVALAKSRPGKLQFRLGRHRHGHPHGGRAVQAGSRREHRSRAVQGGGAGDDGADGGRGGHDVQRRVAGAAARQGGQGARARGRWRRSARRCCPSCRRSPRAGSSSTPPAGTACSRRAARRRPIVAQAAAASSCARSARPQVKERFARLGRGKRRLDARASSRRCCARSTSQVGEGHQGGRHSRDTAAQ